MTDDDIFNLVSDRIAELEAENANMRKCLEQTQAKLTEAERKNKVALEAMTLDSEGVQCYLYTLLDEAKRRGWMFPQTREEQNDDSKAIARVADMVRFYGQQGYPKQNAIAKLQALRERNRK